MIMKSVNYQSLFICQLCLLWCQNMGYLSVRTQSDGGNFCNHIRRGSKGKDNVFLIHCAMKMYRRFQLAPTFLTSALCGGE
jgi:hypothetical protein